MLSVNAIVYHCSVCGEKDMLNMLGYARICMICRICEDMVAYAGICREMLGYMRGRILYDGICWDTLEHAGIF